MQAQTSYVQDRKNGEVAVPARIVSMGILGCKKSRESKQKVTGARELLFGWPKSAWHNKYFIMSLLSGCSGIWLCVSFKSGD